MSYSTVKKPRFFINTIEYLIQSGIGLSISDSNYEEYLSLYRTMPSKKFTLGGGLAWGGLSVNNIPNNIFTEQGFCAILGHNFNTAGNTNSDSIECRSQINNDLFSMNPIVNWDTEFDGFSIATTNELVYSNAGSTMAVRADNESHAMSVIFGDYYDMFSSPDLSLTMVKEYDTQMITTKGGSTLSNQNWNKPAMWGDHGSWELHNSENIFDHRLSKTGRRVWNLSFSYLDDGDLFGPNQMLDPNTLQSEISGLTFDDGDVTSGVFANNIHTDINFYSQVINKTLGGKIPFIFQPDNTYPDFAICIIDSSFLFDQVAPSVYNTSLTIREVW